MIKTPPIDEKLLYQKMMEEVVDYSIILLDINGKILNANRGTKVIKGYSTKQILNKNFDIFYSEEDRKAKLPETILKQAKEKGRATHEGWRVKKNGDIFWGMVVITAIHDDKGRVIGYSKVTRDLTEKKKFEDFILLQNKQLEEYAHVTSHDLQEPLRKISMFAGRLEDSLDNKELAKTYIDKIKASTEKMTNLIIGVLNYTEAQNIQSLKTKVNLNYIVSDVISDFDFVLEQREGVINVSPLPTICAIPTQMTQVFSNLISNAIKFNNGSPIISISAAEFEDVSGKYIKIAVADNGIGFEQEYETKVFHMFQRLDTNKKGSGIGLALCKKIIEQHNGTIEVQSEVGKGTTFTIVLPIIE